MRLIAATAFLAALRLAAQTFDPTMPASVPAATGTVMEAYGLRYIEIKTGDGAAAAPNQEYTVHYTGWLRNGARFDSSVDRGAPLKFIQGRRAVIAGWDSGFEGMKVGGKRRLFIPYQLGYGELGRGAAIPPKAELIFDVELLGVRNVPPAPAAGADLNAALPDMEARVMALAKAVPEEKYYWRPAPGVRTFQQVFLHIAYGSQLMLNMAIGNSTADALQKQVEENSRNEKQPVNKPKVIEALTVSFAALHRAIDAANNNSLSREINLFGTATTTRGELIRLETHIAEHLGQAIAYARMNGIVPPWSQ
jgi:peptidylprolyl isomerase